MPLLRLSCFNIYSILLKTQSICPPDAKAGAINIIAEPLLALAKNKLLVDVKLKKIFESPIAHKRGPAINAFAI